MMRRMTLSLGLPCDESELMRAAERELGCRPVHFRLIKKSIDARKKNDVRMVYTFEYGDSAEPDAPPLPRVGSSRKILIVGSGPAGMFCAVRLADRGLKPTVVERGGDVDGRAQDMRVFFGGGELNENSNVQFGEGGAGTFSDGKLNTNTHNGYVFEVYRTFVRFGAPDEILYLNKPHIGSDKLRETVKSMREYIISAGCEVRFYTRMTKLHRGKRVAAEFEDVRTGLATEEEFDDVVLAVGHSARDTFEMLYESGFAMESREFAVGVRIEHDQQEMNTSQYGRFAQYLPPADYKAVSDAGERKVFTFCMCPGGYVVPAQSEKNTIVTNGMSLYARGGENSNSALLAQVRKSDFDSDHPLAGVEYQRRIERAAYAMTGGRAAPAMRLGDFMKDADSASGEFCLPRISCRLPEYSDVMQNSASGKIMPTYAFGVKWSPLGRLLPVYIVHSLQAGIRDIARRIRGFDDPQSILTAPETRFSSPVRILRGENYAAVGTDNIYPCGEGAGYSGGITSSATDGMRIADEICRKCR